ncbi:hypothetical protein LTR08_005576 [Meristemomyces frigidus]|nr:hypothetical protein LTR08_005576 [Meristemomyces frigidus]
MLIKQSSFLLSAFASLHSLPSIQAAGSSTSSTCRRREGTRQQASRCGQCRGSATIATDPPERQEGAQYNGRQDHTWPKPKDGQTCPTPYQIFAMKHNAVYSKTRFYEMVKYYHPDLRTDAAMHNDSHQVQMERYRLIVAAHGILSDPVKRSAYDRLGAGWDGKAEAEQKQHGRSGAHEPGPFSHSWSDPADSIWQNATWEDWERFHARKARQQGTGEANKAPQTVYMQNSRFIVLVVFLAGVGGSANYSRAQDAGTYYIEQRDVVHDKAAKDLRKVRQEMSTMTNRQERIQWFLRQREATMGQMAATDIEAMREEKANRLLSGKEVCRSDDIAEKDT